MEYDWRQMHILVVSEELLDSLRLSSRYLCMASYCPDFTKQ